MDRAVVARPSPGLTDRGAVGLAVGVCAGAWAGIPHTTALGVILVVSAWVVRRPWVFVVGVMLVASGMAARATAGLESSPGVFAGTVEVVAAATTARGDVHAEVRADGRHLDLVPPADGQRDVARAVARAEPGERLVVHGRVSPGDPQRSRSRGSHVAGRLYADRVSPGGPPRLWWRMAGSIRDTVRHLGRPLPANQRVLFDGFVLGDASGQSAFQRADFRASGLTHLLVASGENVAFVLMLAAPLLTRVGFGLRWFLIVALTAAYALVTGLEPSVLRAAAMAVVATSAQALGRPARSLRSLAFAITLLVLLDPFLVHSVAFLLSVGASLGIITLARPLAAVLPGPYRLRGVLAVTLAAQIGVAPLLLGFPAGLPVAAFPANLLAALPAGLVMVVGLPALVLAATGLAGSGVFVWIPRFLLGWVDHVARVSASADLGYLGLGSVLVVSAAVGLLVVLGRGRARWLRWSASLALAGALVVPVVSSGSGPPADTAGGSPIVVRRGSLRVVVLTGRVPDEMLLTDLSVARVRRVDVLVVPRGGPEDRAMVATIARRHPIGRVVAPRAIPDTPWQVTVVSAGERLEVGAVPIEVIATSPVLSVHVGAP